jgi:hypothetical protein
MNDLNSRIVPAPMEGDPRLRSTILDVVCGPHEDIEWFWTMTNRGSFVSGYSIVRRARMPDPPKTSTRAKAARRRKGRSG